jgi:hypothetical protein
MEDVPRIIKVVVNIMEASIKVPRRPINRRRKLANRAAGMAPIGGELAVGKKFSLLIDGRLIPELSMPNSFPEMGII